MDVKLQNAFIRAAKAEYEEDGRIEFDDTPGVSMASNDAEGAYVSAWVWVSLNSLEGG